MTTKPIGLYVHIPFCKRKCRYCDFCSYAGVSETERREYTEALCREIRGYEREKRIAVDTVFFGGGTPSLLEPRELSEILEAVKSAFDVLPDAELTLEANPGTLTRDKLLAYRLLGVNRLSIGLQSIHENELKKLGRIHSYPDFLESYRLAREVGFDNIGVDLMYGIPEQTVDSFGETLASVIAIAPEHISAYGLIIEEGTPFYDERDSLALPDEDSECDMYCLACAMLGEAGYSHYEISNYARAGRESRHNLHYWRDEEYIGVGVAAHSYFEGYRFANPDSIAEYLAAPVVERLLPDAETEYVMLAFRLAEGLSLTDYKARFSRGFTEGREDSIRRYTDLGLMLQMGDRLALTERGFYVSNAILSDLL